jgi:hypothetical protein
MEELTLKFPPDAEFVALLNEFASLRDRAHDRDKEKCAMCQLVNTAERSPAFNAMLQAGLRYGPDNLALTAFLIGQLYGRKMATEELTKIAV